MTTEDSAQAPSVTRAPVGALAAARWSPWKQRALSYGPLSVAVAVLAHRAIGAILAKVGHPGASLDDAYIHFQYARALAEGHPLRFQAGEPFTSGATSILWPTLLAPFWALGARDEAILWPAWGLSFLALGALAWEAARLTDRLAGRASAIAAGAMVLSFGGFAWCAASGMEVVPFAWVIARASRRASEWAEDAPEARSRRRAVELVGLAWAAALFRPEGAVTALFVTATLAAFPHFSALRTRALALVAGVAVIALPFLLWALTGSARSNTAVAKLLPGNPYYVGSTLTGAVEANAKLLVLRLLNGEVWSAEFLPSGGWTVAMAGLAAVALLGLRKRAQWRAIGVLLIALTMFAPCAYYTFLWNRLRYLWPFATGWFVGLACFARVLGDLAGKVRGKWRLLTPILGGVFVGMLATKLDWALDDAAQSASGIDRQQVALGRWAKQSLPATARIGVNDTGAIAYFGEHKTFDVVGLTTEGEARYWVAGVGSRLEHYERLQASTPSKLPTHFIVYPSWMGMDVVLGPSLQEATVTDSTILGGQTMRVYEADWSKLGTGEAPWTPAAGPITDVLDVADLESESEHGYDLNDAREGEEVARDGLNPDGAELVDGGRTRRTEERFVVHLRAGAAAQGIVRFEAVAGTHVHVLANGEPIAAFEAEPAEDWVERTFEIPREVAAERTSIVLRFSGGVTTFHYWFIAVN